MDNISKRELSPYELIFLNQWQLRFARNMFFAFYRYPFKDEELFTYFYIYCEGYDEKSQVPVNHNFSMDLMNPVEKKNVETIRLLEDMVGR
ncbi:YARHG domain-containing protein [Brucepastera parasyntrophica]|uniref:YARHG domain-containing protein n=1 Tax=Brucepastera parasyntrophica TaxID=2880008 RepID=UPI002108C7BA|nr:YARHG domain-containing protein [Brucepastera parasyntrophica]ULQ58527.1 YARHG domain-containing protein [Brucepastera parasyntrophica]